MCHDSLLQNGQREDQSGFSIEDFLGATLENAPSCFPDSGKCKLSHIYEDGTEA